MTLLILWHTDLAIELRGIATLTDSITDPDHMNAFDVFGDRLQAVVDQGPPPIPTSVETADLPWKSRETPEEVHLEGLFRSPVNIPAGSRLTVHSTMTVSLRPVFLRAPRPSFNIGEVESTIVVERPDGATESLVMPVFRGRTFRDAAAMPSLATFPAVVEALSAVAFKAQMDIVRRASDFDDWDELYRVRARRLGAWHAETIAESKQPSRTLHNPALPPDLFVRATKVKDRPKRRRVSA